MGGAESNVVQTPALTSGQTALRYPVPAGPNGAAQRVRAVFDVGAASIPGHAGLFAVGVYWKLPDGREGNSVATPWFDAPADGLLRYRLRVGTEASAANIASPARAVPPDQTELGEVTASFPRAAGSPSGVVPVIDAIVGGTLGHNIIHLRGQRESLSSIILLKRAGAPAGPGATWRLGVGRAPTTRQGPDFTIPPLPDGTTTLDVVVADADGTRRLKLEVVPTGPVVIGHQQGAAPNLKGVVSVTGSVTDSTPTAVSQTFLAQPYHVGGTRPTAAVDATIAGTLVSVPTGAAAEVEVPVPVGTGDPLPVVPAPVAASLRTVQVLFAWEEPLRSGQDPARVVYADGIARLPVLLPNGRVDAAGLLGMDVLLPGVPGSVPVRRSYADRRFARPAPVAGGAPTTISGPWAVCETGATGTGALPAAVVPPGGHLVLLATPPQLVDRTAINANLWDPATLRRRLQATDLVSLTAPAFGSTPDRADATGRPLPRTPATAVPPDGGLLALTTAAGGSGPHRLDRGLLAGSTAASVPFALLDRLEVAAATTAAAGATAVIGSLPPVPWALEPAADLALGHPGVPAAIERHGTGVALSGAPAVAVAEYVRERTPGLGFGFVRSLAEPARSMAVQSEVAVAAEAATALPVIADGVGAGPVVAVLRTVAAGMEGMPGVGVGATQPGANLFPFSQNAAALTAWLNDQVPAAGGAGNALRAAAAGQIDSITRALDRRVLAAAFGAREVLVALLAAIDRAQDLIYLETPAVDQLPIDTAAGGENLDLWGRLLGRLAARKGLRVVLCVPSLLAPGTPRKLQEVRNHSLLDAVGAIRAAAAGRFALFSPGVGAGRALRFASTSVVVDDAFALTGTTHLWRRGLSFDSSLAAAVFDERVVDGRPQDVRAFRMQLMADRLGIPATGCRTTRRSW